jgi:hypothetical protein
VLSSFFNIIGIIAIIDFFGLMILSLPGMTPSGLEKYLIAGSVGYPLALCVLAAVVFFGLSIISRRFGL